MRTSEAQTLQAVVSEAPVSRHQIDAFARATASQHTPALPPTFYTLFRRAEYQIMDKLDTKWQYLLHSEQEYEYFETLKEGQTPEVRARLADMRERKAAGFLMSFIKLESDIMVSGRPVARVRTSFVIREPLEDAK